MQDIRDKLKTASLPVLLYGTGRGADKILDSLYGHGVKISGVFASDGFVRSRTFRGFEVISYDEAKCRFGRFVAVFAFGSSRPEVIENIKKIMSEQTLVCADVSVYGSEIFDLCFAKKHHGELEKVYSLLCDEQSKKVFKQTCLFKIDGNVGRLFSCESSEDEAFENILRLTSGCRFLDLGAYNGDTALDFARRCPDFGKITALEPDPKSFLKLCENTKQLSAVLINAAASDRCTELAFRLNASRSSCLGEGKSVRAITVDSLSDDYDYIKFDVEGQELSAISGAAKTIRRCRPKMLVSCYHRADDYFKIPEKILSIVPDYKIYMRHFPSVPAWDTGFYFV